MLTVKLCHAHRLSGEDSVLRTVHGREHLRLESGAEFIYLCVSWRGAIPTVDKGQTLQEWVIKEIMNLTGRICKGSLETVNISHPMKLKNKRGVFLKIKSRRELDAATARREVTVWVQVDKPGKTRH